MGRIRTIKPAFFQNEELSSLDAETHLLAGGLLCYADDYGYFLAHPKLVQAAVFPIREIFGRIPEMLRSLQTIGYLKLGTDENGKHYGHIINFDKHQRVSHPTASLIKDLQIIWEDSGKIPEVSGKIRQGIRNKEGNKEGIPESEEWLPKEAWEGWLEIRKKKKSPLTERAKQVALGKLERWHEQGYDLTVILDAAILGNWQGLYLPKDDHGQEIKPAQLKVKWVTGDPDNPDDWAAATHPDWEAAQ